MLMIRDVQEDLGVSPSFNYITREALAIFDQACLTDTGRSFFVTEQTWKLDDLWSGVEAIQQTLDTDLGINLPEKRYGPFVHGDDFQTEANFLEKSQTYLKYQETQGKLPKGFARVWQADLDQARSKL
jgi:hypothetical protein